jgi:anti-sigma B factor antagonist
VDHTDEPPTATPLLIETRREGAAALVRVTGELDAYTSPQLSDACRALVDDDVRDVRIDLQGATFIDSSGLRALLLGHRQARDGGGTLRVVDASEPVRRLFEITGLSVQLGLAPSGDV